MLNVLTHWGRVTHICVSKLTIIGSDNGLSPGRRQAIIWTNDGILLIRPLGTNFSEILIEIHIFSFKEMHLKMSSGSWRPFCLGLNVLTKRPLYSDKKSSNTVFDNEAHACKKIKEAQTSIFMWYWYNGNRLNITEKPTTDTRGNTTIFETQKLSVILVLGMFWLCE